MGFLEFSVRLLCIDGRNFLFVNQRSSKPKRKDFLFVLLNHDINKPSYRFIVSLIKFNVCQVSNAQCFTEHSCANHITNFKTK